MPDFNDQFSRFMDQFQQSSRADSRNNEEIATTLRDLLEEQKKMREYQIAQDRLKKSAEREDDIEKQRAQKTVEDHQQNVENGNTNSGKVLSEMLGYFKSPAVIGAAIGLAVADSMTKVNLRETLFAGTILSKVGGARLMTAFRSVAGAPGKMATHYGRALSAKGAKGPKPTMKNMTSILKPGEKIKHGSRTARLAGGALRGVGSTSGGILNVITSVLKPLGGILKPFMSVLKLAGRATVVLTPIIAIIEGVVKAMKVFQEGGSISEVIFGFLMGALESLTTGLLEGLTTLGNWLVTIFDEIPVIIGDIIDGVFDFAANLFSGTAESKIGQMLLDFVYSFGPVLLDLGIMVVKLIWSTFTMVPKILYRLALAIGGAIAKLGSMIKDWVVGLWHWATDSAATAKKRAAAAAQAAEDAEKLRQAAEDEENEALKNKLLAEAARNDAAKADLEAADVQANDAEDRRDTIVGKLKGLKKITADLMVAYGSSIAAFTADPGSAMADMSQASARGADRTDVAFPEAHGIGMFGGERSVLEKRDAAQNQGTKVLSASMQAEMQRRENNAAARQAIVDARSSSTSVTNNTSSSNVMPKNTGPADRSLRRAGTRDKI